MGGVSIEQVQNEIQRQHYGNQTQGSIYNNNWIYSIFFPVSRHLNIPVKQNTSCFSCRVGNKAKCKMYSSTCNLLSGRLFNPLRVEVKSEYPALVCCGSWSEYSGSLLRIHYMFWKQFLLQHIVKWIPQQQQIFLFYR